jgi:hypothetical protein
VIERPILMSGEMVRALLDGRKAQTRRLMNPQPASVEYWLHGEESDATHGHPIMRDESGKGWASCGPFKCRQGKPGDRLWVREAFIEALGKTWYRASPPKSREHEQDWRVGAGRWTPSIHMPRKASRITLEVTSVRVERLQAITAEDIRAEGVQLMTTEPNEDGKARAWISVGEKHSMSAYLTGDPKTWSEGVLLRAKFAGLWDSLNGERASWASSPWVWVVSFKRIEADNG